jgi:hypothetical protein
MNGQTLTVDILLLINNLSLSNQKNILRELNSLLIESTQDLYDNKIKFEDVGLLEKLLFQIIFHNETILKLTEGITIEARKKKVNINDLTSVYSIARLQIETFINLSYLFFVDCEYSKEIRTYVYKIHGLRKQLGLNKKHPKDFEPIQKTRNELAGELKKIRKLTEFTLLPYSKKKKLIYPDHARLLKMNDIYFLIKIGDLSKSHSLYSNHIHSEYISIRQLQSAINNTNQIENSFSVAVMLCSRMTASVLKNLNEKFTLKDSSYSKSPLKIQKVVDVLNDLSSKMK